MNMTEISFMQKLKLMREYKYYIKKSKSVLTSNNFRIDGAYRIYTIINVPMDQIPEEYKMVTSDVIRLEREYVDRELSTHRKFFSQIGIGGLYSEPTIIREQPSAYLVYYNYKFLDNIKYHNVIKVLWATVGLLAVGLGFYIF